MYEQTIKIIKNKLDLISPSFCAAKWQQVTLHLHTGHTHSCHHPKTHKVPLSELKDNPSALHNTNYKKQQRKMMIDGERPSECQYCWNVEDLEEYKKDEVYSDRVIKSASGWARPYIDEISKLPWDSDVIPSYLEVSFSNVCNFKCSYCSPQVSSKWMEEVERFGAYPTSTKFGDIQWLKSSDAMPIPHKDHNPYVEAFWQWWPTIYHKLEHFRITGGEPLMSKDTMLVLDYIIEHPSDTLNLSINSNMCVPDALLDNFIEKLKIIVNEKKVKQIKIFTSAEAHGKQAEYIRHGLDYDMWIKNIRRVLDEVPGVTFAIMSTYNALSLFSYKDFLKDILSIKLDYTNKDTKHSPIMIDIPYLRYPTHQSIFILPKHHLANIEEQIDFMEKNAEDPFVNPFMGFFQFEIDKLRRIKALIDQHEFPTEVTVDQDDFILFVDEHDRRRGTNFLEVFPELTDFYNDIKYRIS